MVCGVNFDIDKRYKIKDAVGQGAFGTVVSAIDTEADESEQNEVAIKKIDSAFESTGIMLRTLRELKILRLLEHENLIGI